MEKFSFIAHMPDEPGSLHRAAEIIKKYEGNINRIQFDRRIDPGTVFYEVTGTAESYRSMTRDLASIGYLQTSLKPLDFLKFCVYLRTSRGPCMNFSVLRHRPGQTSRISTLMTGGSTPTVSPSASTSNRVLSSASSSTS